MNLVLFFPSFFFDKVILPSPSLPSLEMLFRYLFVIPFKNGVIFLRPFCSFANTFLSSSESILLRKENFNANRSKILRRNEKSLLAKNGRTILSGKDCATLVLICQLGLPPALESWILFTQRAKKMKQHANEISFPGGRMDGGESVERAAIREAEEEIGLDGRDLKLWGTLRPLRLRNSEGFVTPVLATIGQNVEQRLCLLKCADAEVQNVFVASVSDLLARVCYTTYRFPGKTNDDQMPFYYQMPIFHSTKPRFLCNPSPVNRPESFRIWGLTALTLLEALNSLLPEDAKEREATELLRQPK